MTDETKRFIDEQVDVQSKALLEFWEILCKWTLDMKDPSRNYWLEVRDDIEEFYRKHDRSRFAMDLAQTIWSGLEETSDAVKDLERRIRNDD